MDNKFKSERTRLNLTQQAVAELCGVTKRTVINWEQDSPIPSDKLEILSRHGFDVLYVVTGRATVSSKHISLPNMPLLRQLIAGLEESLHQQSKHISPDKKAEIICLLYEMESQESTEKIAVERILRLVA